MIHSLAEEIYIFIYLICFSIYLVSTYDALIYMLKKLKVKKIGCIISELIFAIMQIIVTYYFSYNLADGYIPIYCILFLIVGWILYFKFLQKPFLKVVEAIRKVFIKASPYIKKLLKNTIYSPKFINTIKKIGQGIKQKIKKYLQKLKKEPLPKQLLLQEHNEINPQD